eukprot:jgi/Galph1/494/GphlegSOOS_G5172.1
MSISHRDLDMNNSLVIFCDLQVGFQSSIPNIVEIIDSALFLRKSADLLSIPCLFTEQWPERYSHVVEQLAAKREETCAKRTFSLMGSPEAKALVLSKQRKNIVFAGVQAHICVQQSVLDLIKEGFNIFLVADAIGSRRPVEYRTAIDAMKAEGAVVSTTEAVVFQWFRSIDNSCFEKFNGLKRPE